MNPRDGRGEPTGSARCPGNDEIAGRLDEVAALLEAQNAGSYRVRAYHRAAETLRRLEEPVSGIHARAGLEGLESLPGIGESIARAIAHLLAWGRLPLLERLRGGTGSGALLRTVPGIGPALAARLHEELGIESLEELEIAAHDGRLERMEGFGAKRLAAVRDTLAHRLARLRAPQTPPRTEPPVTELLDVDRAYRDPAVSDRLPRIAPRRMNPDHRAWLPILHTRRGNREYTALYSNTPRAHRLGRTRDWVVLYVDGGGPERQYTVVTEGGRGPLAGRRVVRGRERECLEAYEAGRARPDRGGSSRSPASRTTPGSSG
jgi:DNA polymerase (family 10)